MKISQKLLVGLVSASALIPLTLVTSVAHAQQYNQQRNYAQSAPQIEGFNVEEVRHLTPGVELNFELAGTPGGIATLRIAGATRSLALIEIESGQYEGTYTINSRDNIAARSAVTANLRIGNQVASTVLNESLQIGVGSHNNNPMPGAQPQVSGFGVDQVTDLDAGSELNFRVVGTPGGKADVSIAGVRSKILLAEVKRGEYEGSYRIRNRDRVMPNSVVKANLTVGENVTTVLLAQSLQSATAPAAAVRPAPICNNCGTVEAINLVQVKGDGNYLGTIGGGLLGGLLGSQVGGGNGRTVAEIAGAVGGAYAGNRVEANSRKSTHYEVLVRFQNGGTQTFTLAAEPDYRVGDKVKNNEGVIVRI